MSCTALPPRMRSPRCWRRRAASGSRATRPRLTGRMRPWAPGRRHGARARGPPPPGCSPTGGRAAGRRAAPGPPASSPTTTPGASWLRGPRTERYGASPHTRCPRPRAAAVTRDLQTNTRLLRGRPALASGAAFIPFHRHLRRCHQASNARRK